MWIEKVLLFSATLYSGETEKVFDDGRQTIHMLFDDSQKPLTVTGVFPRAVAKCLHESLMAVIGVLISWETLAKTSRR